MFRRAVTDRQLVLSLAQAIATHPLIKDPPIFPPVIVAGTTPQPVRITKIRTFAGPELSEPGLTLSVYPATNPRSLTQKSIRFKDVYVGQADTPEYAHQATHDICVELSLQDPDFDIPITLNYDEITETLLGTAHGRQISSQDPVDSRLYSEDLNAQVRNKPLEVFVVPAEEILREYVTLVRCVVRDIETFSPWMFRNPNVVDVNYASSELFDREPANIIFHRAVIRLALDVYEPALARDFSYLKPIRQIVMDSRLQGEQKTFDLL